MAGPGGLAEGDDHFATGSALGELAEGVGDGRADQDTACGGEAPTTAGRVTVKVEPWP